MIDSKKRSSVEVATGLNHRLRATHSTPDCKINQKNRQNHSGQ